MSGQGVDAEWMAASDRMYIMILQISSAVLFVLYKGGLGSASCLVS